MKINGVAMPVKNIMQFLYEVRLELSKVVWPKFDEWVGSTIVVLFLVCVFAIYLGAIDLVMSKLARYIFKLYGGF
jgi:preprotein translocase subunit SecE